MILGFPENGDKSHFTAAYKGKPTKLHIYHQVQSEGNLHHNVFPAYEPSTSIRSSTFSAVWSTTLFQESRSIWLVIFLNNSLQHLRKYLSLGHGYVQGRGMFVLCIS